MRTENQGAIVDVDTGARVTFDINPESFEDSKETELVKIPIPGMSHPKLQYVGGGERTLSFTVILHYGATPDVPAAIRTLQAWLYPECTNNRLTRGPSKLLFVFGDTWPDEQWILTSCRVTRNRFNKNLECVFAEVELQLTQYIEDSVDTKDVSA